MSVGVSSQRQSDCHVTASYIMSPLLVVAYAIVGTISIDFNSEPLGKRLLLWAFSCVISGKKQILSKRS